MTLHHITTAVRASEGEVMLCGPTSFGFIIRATINGNPCRIILLSAGKSSKDVLPEPACQTHIISDNHSLQDWLDSFSPKPVLQVS